MTAIQEQLRENACYGCGPDNEHGLRLKSEASDDGIYRATFEPEPWHCAATTKFVNGGIIATVIDCHSVCSATAEAYRRAGLDMSDSSVEPIWFATGRLDVSYQRPVPVDQHIKLRAEATECDERRIIMQCELIAGDKVCCTATVTSVRVPPEWMG